MMSDEGSVGGDIYACPPRRRAPHTDARPCELAGLVALAPVRAKLLLTETIDGGSAVAMLNPPTAVARRFGKATNPSIRRLHDFQFAGWQRDRVGS